jgi:ubiquinone/menaquinone biosynthesis C-methylase UbiE
MANESLDPHGAAHFDQLSSVYDDFVGVVTGDVGRYAIDHLLPVPTSESVIHDNACGTGLMTAHFQQVASQTGHARAKKIHATDYVPSVTQVLQHKASRNGWKNVDISVMDSQELGFPDNSFDLSIMNFGLFFLPDPQKGAGQIYRTLKPGGVAVVTTWKKRHMMDTIAAAQKIIRPDLESLHAPWADLWSKEETLRDVLVNAGFEAENVKIVERRTDAIVEPFLRDPDMVARAYPAATKGWTEEERARLGKEMLRIAREVDPQGGGAGGLYSTAYIAVAKK